jgi:hypothetical protein
MRNKWTSGWDGNWFYYPVSSDQKADFHGTRTYLLSSKMTMLGYPMEVPFFCGPKDANFTTFIEATSFIGGRDVVEEFLAYSLRPLGQQFGFQVEMKESPLSKVLVSMPQVTAAIWERESEAKFVHASRKPQTSV